MFLEAVDVTHEMLNDIVFKCESRVKPTYFTREGNNKLDFRSTILFLLNFVRRSLQQELNDFFELFHDGKLPISKQGFSAARMKIKPEAFRRLHERIVDLFYDQGDYKTFMGYRLCAIDASILEINNSQRMKDAYDSATGTSIELARAKTSCIYDIENNLIVKALITKYTAGEREVAKELIESLKESGLKNDLLLFDRGYPSIDFFFYLMKSNVKFLIRLPGNYYKNRIDKSLSDQLIEFKLKGATIKLRVVRFQLNSGVEEVLITNLMDNNLELSFFKSLYFKRWGIETKYAELKTKLQIEKFTGDSSIAVEQDFYASIYLSNMAALIKHETDQIISKDHEGKGYKHKYKTNVNMLIGTLKNKLTRLLLEKCLSSKTTIYNELLIIIARDKVSERSDRVFKRRKSLKANKNSLNLRTCI